jgi:hypothetical protein
MKCLIFPSFIGRVFSKNAAHQAAIDAQGGAVDRRGERAADERDDAGDFRGVDQSLDERRGAVFLHEAALSHLEGLARKEVPHEFLHAHGLRRTGQDGVHCNRSPFGEFRQAAGYRELHGLGRGVVRHLRRGANGRFARQENDAAGFACEHGLEVVPGQPHAAEDVHIEQALPGFVGLVEKAHGLVDAEVVDEDVHLWELADRFRRAFGRAVVGGELFEFRAGEILANRGDGGVHAGGGASVDDDTGAFPGESAGDFEADASGAGGDECELVVEFQVHSIWMVAQELETRGCRTNFHSPGVLPSNSRKARMNEFRVLVSRAGKPLLLHALLLGQTSTRPKSAKYGIQFHRVSQMACNGLHIRHTL